MVQKRYAPNTLTWSFHTNCRHSITYKTNELYINSLSSDDKRDGK